MAIMCNDLVFTMYILNHTPVVFNADSIMKAMYSGVQSFQYDLRTLEVKVLVIFLSNH